MSRRSAEHDADVVVVGAGPGGSAAAYHLARAGLAVLLLEKTAFPREKVCGDGLTPRGVRPLVRMGIDVSPEAGWLHNKGLRIHGGGLQLHLEWPELVEHAPFGLVRKRVDFDELLARQAVSAGADLRERTPVSGPLLDERTGRVVGVVARSGDTGDEVAFRAPVTVVADGNSSRFSVALGLERLENRPMGVAIRTYFTSPRHDDDWLESWLELWSGAPRRSALMPGYGWVFGMGDGTSNVGLGGLNSSKAFREADSRKVLRSWLATLPREWQFTDDHQVGPVRGAAVPMAFNRQPHYHRGALLVGDAGGMVSPFNGEGIPYAMESGELAAEVVAQALARRDDAARERVLRGYPKALKDRYGGYYTLGRIFAALISRPEVMRLCTRYGLPRPLLMRFTLKLLANLTDPRGGDAMDRLINALCKAAPAA